MGKNMDSYLVNDYENWFNTSSAMNSAGVIGTTLVSCPLLYADRDGS